MTKSLQSVFNILNGNKERKVYKQGTLDNEETINYPLDENFNTSPIYFLKMGRKKKKKYQTLLG